jgi:thiamine-phosphate pyrophosphorylase
VSFRGLYPIVDLASLERWGVPAVAFSEQVLSARPPLLQLRAKSAGARETLALLRALAPLCRAAGTLLFANDRPDLALLSGADGVHVGQDDLPLAAVRQLAPNLRVGKSTHTLVELEAALAERPDYVAFGPVFATPSKRDHEPVVGLAGLAAAHELAQRAGIPLIAIGGIAREQAAEIARHAEAAAVIGALIPEDGTLAAVSLLAAKLTQALDRTLS